MSIEPWQREEWVISRAGFRYLTWLFWGQLPFLLLCPFLVYFAAFSFLGKPTPVPDFGARLVLGAIGGTAALCAVALDKAMKTFARNRKKTGDSTSKLWRLGWILPFFGPPLLYFLLVYRPKMKESGFAQR